MFCILGQSLACPRSAKHENNLLFLMQSTIYYVFLTPASIFSANASIIFIVFVSNYSILVFSFALYPASSNADIWELPKEAALLTFSQVKSLKRVKIALSVDTSFYVTDTYDGYESWDVRSFYSSVSFLLTLLTMESNSSLYCFADFVLYLKSIGVSFGTSLLSKYF